MIQATSNSNQATPRQWQTLTKGRESIKASHALFTAVLQDFSHDDLQSSTAGLLTSEACLEIMTYTECHHSHSSSPARLLERERFSLPQQYAVCSLVSNSCWLARRLIKVTCSQRASVSLLPVAVHQLLVAQKKLSKARIFHSWEQKSPVITQGQLSS